MSAPKPDLESLAVVDPEVVRDPELRATLEKLGRTIAKWEQEEQAQKPESEKKASAKVIQLPLWPEPKRAVPNDILRSALFAAIQGKGREYTKQRLIAAYDGVQIKYTGEQLDQSDLDVWEQVLHLARQQPLGTVCRFTAYALLKALGRSTGKSDYQWLHNVLLRLQTCAVEIYKRKHIYARSLVAKFDIDETSRCFKVTIDPDMMQVYTAGWTSIDWEERQQLRGKPLALWLHGYYASHAAPLPVKVETLRALSGSRTAAVRKFRQLLRAALNELKAIGAIEAWEIDVNDLVHVYRGKAITDSQRRHLSRPKASRSRQK